LLAALLAAAGLTVAGAALAAGNSYGGTTTQPAQSTSETSKMAPATDTKGAAPSKAESPDMAFKKLDMGGKGYVSKEDTHALSGFDKAFQDNDANHDGKLTQAEFNKAWTEYTGNKQ
jgi:hypothetical protein